MRSFMMNLIIASFALALITSARAEEASPVEAEKKLPSGWVIAAGQEQAVTGAVNKAKEAVGGIDIPGITVKGGTIQVTVNAGPESDVFSISYNPDSDPKVNITFEKTGTEVFAKTKDALQKSVPESLWTFAAPNPQIPVDGEPGEGADSTGEGPGIMFWVYIALIFTAAAGMIFLIYRFLSRKKPA
ncbi:MAG: hypothetical protein FJ088_11975 [Deltaproteobacteria bacterium]|nr:hypothetical protein [Deltaproteobacteria bacterium]